MKKGILWLTVVMLIIGIVGVYSFTGCKAEEAVEEEAPAEEVTEEEAPAEEAPAEEVAEEKFGLDSIPEIENKNPINMILETGGFADIILPFVERFSEKTGITVNVERIASPVVYSKENIELVAETGVYDVAYVETSWTSEWAKYLYDLRELATQFDPGGVEAFEADIENHSPITLQCGTAYGKQMVLPFYMYDMALMYRQDVYDDPTEQADFNTEYGYDLAPPTTFDELYDQAEFFTRAKGEMLMGEPLTEDLWGVAMMAGAYQDNDEFSCYLWGKDADYATVVKNDDGSLKEFVITQNDKTKMKEALTQYIALTKYGSPGDLTANFDFAVAQQGEGRAIIQPTQFTGVFPWTASLLAESNPDARIGLVPTLGSRPYAGAWSLGVVKAGDNNEGAYWLVRLLSSYDAQYTGMRDGGQVATRLDVLSLPEWQSADKAYPFGVLSNYLMGIWADKDYKEVVANRYYFNSSAAGKVYEMQMDVLAKGIHGELSVDECVDELVEKTIDLTSKNDDVPIREE